MLGRLGGDASKLLPKNSSLSVTSLGGSVFNADNSAPQAVAASLSGNTMSWSKSASNDVVGYRVYDVTRRFSNTRFIDSQFRWTQCKCS